jgi:hypothetical protein
MTPASDPGLESERPGRAGKIVESVRDLLNETGGGFVSDQFIMRMMNRCQDDLAQEGYWRRESWAPCVAGSERIDLLSAIPDYEEVFQVFYSDGRTPLTRLGSYREFEEFRRARATSGTPERYMIQNDGLFFWPLPTEDLNPGFRVFHSYLPEEIDFLEGRCDPAIPKSRDMVFVYYVLKSAFLRDRHAPGADLKYQEYSILYDAEKIKLLGRNASPSLSLKAQR